MMVDGVTAALSHVHTQRATEPLPGPRLQWAGCAGLASQWIRPGGSDTSGELDKPVTPDLTHASLGSTLSGDIVYVLSLILFK